MICNWRSQIAKVMAIVVLSMMMTEDDTIPGGTRRRPVRRWGIRGLKPVRRSKLGF